MRSRVTVPLILAAATLGACEFIGLDDNNDGALFITQSAPQAAVMQALYVGAVTREGDCYRLAGDPAGHTVVWPHGFRLAGPKKDMVMTDAGKVIGQIGGEFRLGGGEVETLWEGGPVANPARQAALTTCPGRYWLVGETD